MPHVHHSHDPRPFLVAVVAVGITVIATGAGVVLLTVLERQIPTALIALGSNALGLLGGLLVPRPSFSPH